MLKIFSSIWIIEMDLGLKLKGMNPLSQMLLSSFAFLVMRLKLMGEGFEVWDKINLRLDLNGGELGFDASLLI